MTLVDTLVGLGVFVAFIMMILMKLKQKNPKLGAMLEEYFPFLKPKEPAIPVAVRPDFTQQVYHEKRTII